MKPDCRTRAQIATLAADVRRLSLFRISDFGFRISDGASLRRRRQSASGLILLLLLCCYGSDLARADDVPSAFEQANKLYEQGRFTEAAAAYEKIIAYRRGVLILFLLYSSAMIL